MLNIFCYEIRKILNKKNTILSVLIILATASLVFINSLKEYDYFNDDRGEIQAIRDARVIKKDLEGPLTDKDLQKCVAVYREIFNNEKNYDANGNIKFREDSKDLFEFIKYYDLFDLLTRTYSSLSTYNANILNDIDINTIETKDIFENRKKNIDKILHFNIDDEISKTTDFKYAYSTGWQSLFSDISKIHIVLLILITILIAPIFSREYKNHLVPIIYSSRYGKTKVISAKILAAFLVTTIIYFFPILLYTFVKLTIFGYDGFNSLIQTTSPYWLSLFNFTFLEAYIFILLTGYIASIATATLCMLFSVTMKKDAVSIIASLLVLLLPLMVSNNLTLQPFFEFFPSNMINVSKILLNFEIIPIFNIGINKIYLIDIVLLLSSLLIVFYLKTKKYKL